MKRIALAALLVLSGCTVGPDFVAPVPETPAHWPASAGLAESEPTVAWWRSFDDPELASLVDRAVEGNLDLRQAVLRIATARLATVEAGAAGLPSLSGNASYARDQFGIGGITSEQGSFGSGSQSLTGVLSKPVDFYQTSFDASWELDLFGRVRRSVEEARAEADSALENRNDAQVSLEAEVADTYIRLRGAQAETALVTDTVQVESDLLELTRRLAQSGLTSELDLQTVAARLSTTRARLPLFEQQTAVAMNRLALLLGVPPGTLDAELRSAKPLPPVPPQIAVGLPSSLARRRPDIRRAEAELRSAVADEGVAVASLYPDISLTGQIGTRALRAKYLDRWANLFYSIGPSVSIPIFEGGRLEARVTSSRVGVQSATIGYRKAVLGALDEVDDQMVDLRTDEARRAPLEDSEKRLSLAYDLARARFRNGLASALEVRDAERALIDSRDQLVEARIAVARDVVRLYKAIGGGWEAAGEEAQPDAQPDAKPATP